MVTGKGEQIEDEEHLYPLHVSFIHIGQVLGRIRTIEVIALS
jgi:hypothetical protein